MSWNFRRFDALVPLIVAMSVFLLSFISPQRTPLSGNLHSCWRTCEAEPLVSSWGVVIVALACGIAASLARWRTPPIFFAAAIGWLAYGMWAAVAVASYYAGLRCDRVRAIIYLTLAPLLMTVVALGASERAGHAWRGAVVWVLTEIGMLILLPFIYGRWVRGRRQQQVELQEFRAVQARETERTRIAREMHDVVAHRVSLMVLHAGALEIGARDERTVLTAGLIRTAGRQALTELRQVLGVLRGPAEREPLPSIADIPQLVARTRAAGLPVTLDIGFQAPQGTSAVQRTAFRVVQEALTNVVKHAPGASTVVSLACTGKCLVIEVRNEPPPSPQAEAMPSSGLGLIGISERVKVLDGRFHAGATPQGGFLVRAEIPLKATGGTEHDPGADR